MRCQGSLKFSKECTKCKVLWLFSTRLLSTIVSYPCAIVSLYTALRSTLIYFTGKSKNFSGGKTMCFTPHGLLHTSSSYITRIQKTAGFLGFLVWLSSGCDDISSTTWHPVEPWLLFLKESMKTWDSRGDVHISPKK